MNSDTVIDFFKKGFHVTLGATTTFVESLQDPMKRDETLAQMRSNPNELAEILAQKGAVTEGEARKFVDGVVSQYAPNPSTSASRAASTYPTPVVEPELQDGLRELTNQLAQLRAQLTQPGD